MLTATVTRANDVVQMVHDCQVIIMFLQGGIGCYNTVISLSTTAPPDCLADMVVTAQHGTLILPRTGI